MHINPCTSLPVIKTRVCSRCVLEMIIVFYLKQMFVTLNSVDMECAVRFISYLRSIVNQLYQFILFTLDRLPPIELTRFEERQKPDLYLYAER